MQTAKRGREEAAKLEILVRRVDIVFSPVALELVERESEASECALEPKSGNLMPPFLQSFICHRILVPCCRIPHASDLFDACHKVPFRT